MSSAEVDPSKRVSVSTAANSESTETGNNTLDSIESLAIKERRDLAHAGRVLARIENGHNTTSVRHEAYTIIRDGLLQHGSLLEERLMKDLMGSWRHIGTVPDSELDTTYSPPKTSRKRKKAA